MKLQRRENQIEALQTLKIRNVTKAIAGTTVLQDVGLEVRRGQIVGLLGSNGAGKTTLLRVLLGLASHDSGQAMIDGHPFKDLAEPLHTVSAVIDNSTLDPRLSAYANLRVYASAYGISEQRISDVLRVVGLSDAQKKPVSIYSFGMKKRLAIAVSLLTDPAFMVLDEPSNGLDPAGLEWLKNLLLNLAHVQNMGILVSSHLLAEFENILDAVVILHAGKVCYAGAVEDLRGGGVTRVLVADEKNLLIRLQREGFCARSPSPGSVEINGDVRVEVGRLALASLIPLQGLEFRRDSLTSAYFRILRSQGMPILSSE